MTDTASREAAPAAPRRKPLLSRVPAAFVRAVLKGHSHLGLAFAAAIYIVCLSGSLMVFLHEFNRWENPAAPRVEHISADTVQRAIEASVALAAPGVEHVFIRTPSDDLPWLQITTEVEGVFATRVADAEGRVASDVASPFSEFLTALHEQLLLPRIWGMFLVGLTGVALLSSLISGLLAHPRIFRDAFHLRLGGTRRLQEADIHNRIGVWAMPFHVVVALSGALLGLTTLIVGVIGLAVFQGDANRVYALFLPTPPVDNPAPAPMLDVRPMFAQVERLAPGSRMTFIGLEHPSEAGGAVMFNVDTGSAAFSNADVYAFRRDGSLYHQSRGADNNWGQGILSSLGPLHFGWFGGPLIKIAYGLLGLGMTYLAAGGVLIWLARRRDKGRPAPGWERVWAACIWGQPAAIAVAALAGVAAPSGGYDRLLLIWAVVTASFLGAALIRVSSTLLGLAGKVATAGALILAVLAQIVLRGGVNGDPIGWAVNGGLVLISVCLALMMLKARAAASF